MRESAARAEATNPLTVAELHEEIREWRHIEVDLEVPQLQEVEQMAAEESLGS